MVMMTMRLLLLLVVLLLLLLLLLQEGAFNRVLVGRSICLDEVGANWRGYCTVANGSHLSAASSCH